MLIFKENLSKLYKPIKYKHNSISSKYGNMLITRLRVGRSFLNSHCYSIGLSPSPACVCGAPQESSQHIVLSCPLYSSERQALLSTVEQILTSYNTSFLQKSLKVQFEILLYGLNPENSDYLYKNTLLTTATQHFLMKIPRFEV